MLEPDFHGVLDKIEENIRAKVSGVEVYKERAFVPAPDVCPCVILYADSFEAPANMQRIAAGTTTDLLFRVSAWCWAFHMESADTAARLRSDVMKQVMRAFIRDRRIGEEASAAWIESGQFVSAANDQDAGIMSGGEIILVAKMRLIA